MAPETLDADPVLVLDRFKTDVQLACPLFQRRYVWRSDNIEQLFSDIDTVVDEEYPKRFLGALVFSTESAPTAKHAGRYWVIDGQQRLTTLYLILVGIAEVASELGIDGGDLGRDTFNTYLMSGSSGSKGQPRLRPTLVDSRQFEAIVLGAAKKLGIKDVVVSPSLAPGDKSGTMSKGYQTILKAIRKRLANAQGSDEFADDADLAFHTLDGMRSAILEQLEFVEIRLGLEHDPNEVFDRLNKEGERLGIIDLVRNEVLKHLDSQPSLAQQAYNNEWLPFEEGFVDEAAKSKYFFPFALTIDDSVTQATTFRALSRHLQAETGAHPAPERVQEMVRIMRRHLPAYNAVYSGRANRLDEPLRNCVRRLHAMGAPSSILPYALQLVTGSLEGNVSVLDAARCLEVVEAFLVRRAVCGIEPTGLHAIFKKMWRIAQADPMAVRTSITSSTIAYPSDEVFSDAVRHGSLYSRKICRYVIEEYERSFTAGDVLETFPPITIDHVMPQAIQGEWLASFSPDEHARWLHSWANLVPLSNEANTTKGTASWADAKAKLGNETVFSTTKHLYDSNPEWTPDALAARAEVLTSWAIERWPSTWG